MVKKLRILSDICFVAIDMLVVQAREKKHRDGQGDIYCVLHTSKRKNMVNKYYFFCLRTEVNDNKTKIYEIK